MKKVTTKITSKTPSMQSVTQSVTTTMQRARGQQESGRGTCQQIGGGRPGQGQQYRQETQNRNVHIVSSRSSVISVNAAGQRSTRTEESVTTRSQMPIAPGARASGLQQPRSSGLQQPRPSGLQQPCSSYVQQQQQRQQMQSQQQRPQGGIPRIGVPQAMQLGQRQQQIPQGGGGQRRMLQRPQIPGIQPQAPHARMIAQVAPPNLVAQPPQRQVCGSRPGGMMDQFGPGNMQRYNMLEARTPPRRSTTETTTEEYLTVTPPPRMPPQRKMMQQPGFMGALPRQLAATAEQQYAALMDSPSPRKGPCGPVTCPRQSPATPPPRQQVQPRRTMQQPGFRSGAPCQGGMATAQQQYASLLDSPERKSPRRTYQEPVDDSQHDKTADISIRTAASGTPTALERDVEYALMNKSRHTPGTPLRAEGEIKRLATPHESPSSGTAMVDTPEGPMPAETQLLLEGVVKRTAKDEIVTRHILAIEGGMVDERETVHLTPGKGMRRPKTPESVELIVCSSEVRMAGGYRETTTKVVFETTDKPPTSNTPKLPSSVSPKIVSQLVLEESLDVDKTTKLHAPDLKHSSPLTYGIKKRLNALQLNMTEVQELEETIMWPSPRPDQAQDDPQPELLASMMHNEESGMAMGSLPEELYSLLFGSAEKVKADEGTVDVNSVVGHPLNDVVIPASPASRDIHIAALTPELANAAITALSTSAQADEEFRPSDGAYAERVLGDKKATPDKIKARNVSHRDGPPLKYPTFFDLETAPWEVDKFEAIIKQVGAIPTSILEASVVGPSSAGAADELRDYTTDGIEYLLNMDEVSHQNNVQLRGSQPPSWFPGYYMTFGGAYGAGGITVVRSPSLVLTAAYRAVQPDVFNDDSIIVN